MIPIVFFTLSLFIFSNRLSFLGGLKSLPYEFKAWSFVALFAIIVIPHVTIKVVPFVYMVIFITQFFIRDFNRIMIVGYIMDFTLVLMWLNVLIMNFIYY